MNMGSKALSRKALADLRTHRLQFALLFSILVAATLTASLSLTLRQSAERPWDRLFEQTNGAHIVFFAGRFENDRLDLARIAAIEGVAASAGPFPVVWDNTVIHGGQKHALNVYSLGSAPGTMPTVGAPLVTDGSWLTGNGERQVVLDRSFATTLGLSPGDAVDVRGPDGHVSLTVIGLAVNPLTYPYPSSSPGTAYAAPETLALLQPDRQHWGSTLAVRLTNPEEVTRFVMRVRQLAGNSPVATTTWLEARDEMGLVNRVNALILGVVSLFALIAVGLITANVLGGRVLAQFREIGLLKAVGFAPRQIASLLLVEHLTIALAASVIGLAAGWALAPFFLNRAAEAFHTSATPAFEPTLVATALLGVLLLVGVFTLFPAWRGGQISTVRAITLGFAPVHARPSALARAALGLRLPAAVTLGLKDAFARPRRAWMSIAALALTVVTVTAALGVEATIQRLINNPGLDGDPFDLSITRRDVSPEQIEQALAAEPAIESYATSTWVWARADNGAATPASAAGPMPLPFGGLHFSMRALGGDYARSGYLVAEGRMFAAANEAVVGRGLLETLGLKVGDELRVLVDPRRSPTGGRPLTLRIVGRYLESDDDGMRAMFPADTLRQIYPELLPTSYDVQLSPGADAESVAAALLEQTYYGIDVSGNSATETAADARPIRSALLGLSVILVLIGGANLLATTLLGVRERTRDLALFKTLGLTAGQIIVSVGSAAGLLALIAALIGIPLGLLTSKLLFATIGQDVAGLQPEVYAAPPWWWLVLLLPGSIVAAVISSLIPARHAARIEVAQALRAE